MSFQAYISSGDCPELTCEFCADDDAEPIESFEGNYTDCPQNCGYGCGRPLDCTLTDYGVSYVFDAMLDSAQTCGSIDPNNPNGPSYYLGSPHCEIVADWIDMVGHVRRGTLTFAQRRALVTFNRHRATHETERTATA